QGHRVTRPRQQAAEEAADRAGTHDRHSIECRGHQPSVSAAGYPAASAGETAGAFTSARTAAPFQRELRSRHVPGCAQTVPDIPERLSIPAAPDRRMGRTVEDATRAADPRADQEQTR